MRLYPQPEPARLRLYYPERYWHVPSGDAVSELTELYRRLVLYDHVWFVERARRDSGETGPVLDVGCGGGLLLRMLHERGLRVLGLDFALSAASAAWRHNAVPAICGTLSQAPLPDASCSVVTMFHVLEHLYDPRAYLDTAHRLLKPGGRLVVQVPNASCWQFLLLGEMWNGLDIPRHLFDFRSRDLEILLESCGFEVVRRKYFSLRDNPAGLVSSLWPGLDPMARLLRGVPEGPTLRLLKNLTYFALTMLATPFTLIEAACRAGSTVMVEARKRA
ncbi:MAG: class I SAM-dependent methyltransferase [Bryobacterales bacterium]|nr:class I SAM-dependent methyltransferase [Bryobacterales bacterium]